MLRTTFKSTKQTNDSPLLLDCTQFSNTWQEALDRATPYMPKESRYPSLVIPIPNRTDSLIISQGRYYYSPQKTLSTLRDHEAVLQSYDYACWARALRYFDCFGVKLLPVVNRTSCLFPIISSIHHALWINPMEIEEMIKIGDFTRIIMVDGTAIQCFVSKRTVSLHAARALTALATIRRDHLYPDILGHHPLDYLELPNTPFLRSIIKRSKSLQFSIPLSELKRQYETECLTRLFTKLGKKTNLGGLTYTSILNSLNNTYRFY
ncbi:hypothetical protein [Enterococcus sp. AZ109]|uniref:hypothetical protein n=1 Tax=Enterococcus sp. AZ109 TaxID=2774634 RepID=UPI003F1E94BA